MKRIALATKVNGKTVYAEVSDIDYDWLSRYSWYLSKSGGYAYTLIDRHHVAMHRLIMKVTSKWDVVDHADNNKLNNQRGNLRICTHSQNAANKSRQSNATQKYRGVIWCEDKQKWRATIKCEGKWVHIGYFLDEEDAARAYNIKAKELFGEFAKLNDVEVGDFKIDEKKVRRIRKWGVP